MMVPWEKNEQKVYIVFEHDSYDYCGVKGVFDSRAIANKARDIYTKNEAEEGMFYSYFVKEFDVEKRVYSHFLHSQFNS